MTKWKWPLPRKNTIVPVGDHDGAFGHRRRFDMHTGVDLYCEPGQMVTAVEDGEVVGIEIFTGPRAQSPWWKETKAVLIEGASGVILYGEVDPSVVLGQQVKAEQCVGFVMTVRRSDFTARLRRLLHGRFINNKPKTMLHFERYIPGVTQAVWWRHGELRPTGLLDPTDKLLESQEE